MTPGIHIHDIEIPWERQRVEDTGGLRTSERFGKIYLHCPVCGTGWDTKQKAFRCCAGERIENNEHKHNSIKKAKAKRKFSVTLDWQAERERNRATKKSFISS